MNIINTPALSELISNMAEEAVKTCLEKRGTVEKRYLNQKDAAKFLGVSVMKFNLMRHKNLIKPISIDGMLRYDTHDLVELSVKQLE